VKGFTDKGLLLFPTIEAYRDNTESYYTNLQTSVYKLLDYFKQCDIEMFAFTTDDVAQLTNMPDITRVNPLIREDAFFAKKNCRNMSIEFRKCVEYQDALDAAKKALPVKKGQSKQARFEDVLKRVRVATQIIIPKFKLVVHICNGARAAYRVATKAGDERCVLNVHNGKFTISAFLSGKEEDVPALLDKPDANKPVFLW
jgi:hypothetical protein